VGLGGGSSVGACEHVKGALLRVLRAKFPRPTREPLHMRAHATPCGLAFQTTVWKERLPGEGFRLIVFTCGHVSPLRKPVYVRILCNCGHVSRIAHLAVRVFIYSRVA
jgi:hypothetical protein